MKEYNVAALITILMDITADTQITTGKIVLEAVAKHPSVRVDVDDKMISNLMSKKNRREIHGDIKSGASRKEVMDFARDRIEKNLMPKISSLRIDDFCTQVIETMTVDKKVSDGVCNMMQNLYADQKYLDFTTNAVLYALCITNLPKEEITTPEDMLLLSQSNYRCPLNGTALWKTSKKNSSGYTYSFQIVQIYPEDLPEELKSQFDAIHAPPRNYESDDNRIPLCKECAEQYLNNPSPCEYKRLLKCKKQIINKHKADLISAESGIEDEIVIIIKAVGKIDGKTELEPFTDVLKIKEKILPENFVLEESVHDDVVRYYPFIQEQFSLLDGNEDATFDVIRSEVKTCFQKYAREGLDQNTIYAELSEWLLRVNGLGSEYRGAANILISFFVQNCAVFKKIKDADVAPDDGEDDEE